MEGADLPKLGRRVAVYGGGDTAIDVARSVERLGLEPVIIIYRRDLGHSPAFASEIMEAEEEGVQFQWLRKIAKGDESTLTVEEVTLDEQGKVQPTGRFETIEANTVILALGQRADTSFLKSVRGLQVGEDGTVEVNQSMMTGHPGIFAGGDMVPGNQSVTIATGHGKMAARHIDVFLRGTGYVKPEGHAPATFDRLNTWYYTDADQSKQPLLNLIRRRSTFEEIVGGLDVDTALLEARRCVLWQLFQVRQLLCCVPDNAVIKLGQGKRYAINYDYCKGCGLCVEECPCGAIDMVKEVK